jgi:hypothetical protein
MAMHSEIDDETGYTQAQIDHLNKHYTNDV